MTPPNTTPDTRYLAAFLAASREHFAQAPASPNPTLTSISYRKIMNSYRKLIPSLLLAAGAATLFTGNALADDGCDRMSGHDHHERHAKHMEQHHKMLHEALKLTAEQEPGWKKLIDSEQPMQTPDTVKREDWSKLSVPQRAEKKLEHSKLRQEQMSQHVTALKAFYATLTPEQQKTFEDFHAGSRDGKQGRHGAGSPKGDKAPATKP